MPFTIRPASVADADAIGAVSVRAWQSACRGAMPDEYLEGLRVDSRADGWHRILSALPAGHYVLVMVDGGRVVGFAGFGPERGGDASGRIGELYAINLDPEVWDRRLGRALLGRATDQLAQLDYVEAVLWVVPENRRARHVYESEGWSDDNVKRHDEVFGVVVPEMRYRRRLVKPSGSLSAASE